MSNIYFLNLSNLGFFYKNESLNSIINIKFNSQSRCRGVYRNSVVETQNRSHCMPLRPEFRKENFVLI